VGLINGKITVLDLKGNDENGRIVISNHEIPKHSSVKIDLKINHIICRYGHI
jgi:hypothetical protein